MPCICISNISRKDFVGEKGIVSKAKYMQESFSKNLKSQKLAKQSLSHQY